MCNIIRLIPEEERKKVTGYKVAVKLDGKYYSPSTGIEYKVGKVPIVNNREDFHKVSIYTSLRCPVMTVGLHDDRHRGLTQIYIKRPKKEDVDFLVYKKGVLLEMEGYPKYEASFELSDTFLIPEILSMKEIKI